MGIFQTEQFEKGLTNRIKEWKLGELSGKNLGSTEDWKIIISFIGTTLSLLDTLSSATDSPCDFGLTPDLFESQIPYLQKAITFSVKDLYRIYKGFRLTSQSTILHLFLSCSPIFWHIFAFNLPQNCCLFPAFCMHLMVTHNLHLTQLKSSLPDVVSTVHSLHCISGNL